MFLALSLSLKSYLVVTEVWVHYEHVTGSPQTPLFIPSVAEATIFLVISGLHRDKSKESAVIRTTGAESQFFCRIGGQNLTPVAEQTHAVMHDLVGKSQNVKMVQTQLNQT